MNVLATQRGSAHYPSMLEDVEAHRRTEIDLITGALVREADRSVFPCRCTRRCAADQGEGGVLAMKVCVVGCGAVGSLFAANLATLDDVEVWAYDLAREHVDAINRDGLRLTGAGEVVGESARDERRVGAAGLRLRHRRDEGDAHGPAIAATAHAFADGCVATVQNGIGNEEVLAAHVERVIRGTTFPAGKITAPGVVQWDVKGDTTFGPFEEKPAPFEESSGSPTPARAAACRRRPSRTRAGRSGAR